MPNQAFIFIMSMIFVRCGADLTLNTVPEHVVYLQY